MAESVFSRVPVEVSQEWTWYLDRSDLCAYRLTCKEAESHSFEIFAQRCFSTLETSLMGSDVKRLEGISSSPRLRGYVETIFIKDDCERNEQWTPYVSDAGHIWPRDDDQIIQTSAIGVKSLENILAEGRLLPEIIKIQDYHRDYRDAHKEPVAELARMLYNINLAITSLSFKMGRKPNIAVANIKLSRQHQGQDIAFKMLQYAELSLTSKSTSYWIHQVFLRSPSLVDLKLKFWDPMPNEQFQSMFLTNTTSQLKRFCLESATISAQLILTILGNSRESLTDLSLRRITLRHGLTWAELFEKIGRDFQYLESFKINALRRKAGDALTIRFDIINKNTLAEEYRAGLDFYIRYAKFAPRVSGWHYKGSNMSSFLKVIVSKMM